MTDKQLRKTMDYYLVLGKDEEPILIGHQSFGNFYPEHGFEILDKMYQSDKPLNPDVEIRDAQNHLYSMESFLNLLECLKMKKTT